MSISVEMKFQGDVTTLEHQAAIKAIVDAVVEATNNLPGIPFKTIPSCTETKSSMNSRMLLADRSINPEPFPTPTGFKHEVKVQFGFHLNPVAKITDAAVDCPDKQD
jgi:hypothetical protein